MDSCYNASVVRLFAAVFVVGISTACGGQVDIGGAFGGLNVGGKGSSAGGHTSTSTGDIGGSAAASTGGSTAIDWRTYCGGLFVGGCNAVQITGDLRSCDIPLQQSPPDTFDVHVAIDCTLMLQVVPDAGMPGFYIDYSYSPAHLELSGSACTNMLLNGALSVTVIGPCHGGGP